MNRPTVEVADIFRAQGDDFIDRHRHRIRFQQLKVMRAIMRCRTAALGGHIDICPQCGGAGHLLQHLPESPLPQVPDSGTPALDRRPRAGTAGGRVTSMSSSRYRTSCTHLSCKIRIELYNLLFRTVAETLREVARNPNIWEPRLVSSASFIRGGRTCCSIPTFTVSFQAEESHRTKSDGSIPFTHSSCLSRLSAKSSGASSSMDCAALIGRNV